MVHRGHWRLDGESEAHVLAPGDVAILKAGSRCSLQANPAQAASAFRVRATDDPPGPTRWPDPGR